MRPAPRPGFVVGIILAVSLIGPIIGASLAVLPRSFVVAGRVP